MSALASLTRRRKLTVQERLFCDAFAGLLPDHQSARGDGPACARLAMYDGDPSIAARKLLARPHIWRALDRRLAGRVAGPREVLAEITRIATAGDPTIEREIREDGTVVTRTSGPSERSRDVFLRMLGHRYGADLSPLDRKVATLLDAELERLRTAEQREHLEGLNRARSDAVMLDPRPGARGSRGPRTAKQLTQSTIEARSPRVKSALDIKEEPPPWALPHPPGRRPLHRTRHGAPGSKRGSRAKVAPSEPGPENPQD